MNKLDLLKKVLTFIQESLSNSEPIIDNNNGQVNNAAKNLIVVNAPENITDSAKDEQAIKEFARDFARVLNERNFEYIDGRAEYYFYTLDHLIKLIKNNDEQNTIKFFNENRIISKYEDCEFLSITFNEDSKEAVVVYNVKTCILSADAKYFKELNKKINKKNRVSEGTPFYTTYKLLVKREKGAWKIDKFEASEESIKKM